MCQLLALLILVSFRSAEDYHDVLVVLILVVLIMSLVVVWKVPCSYLLLISKHSSIDDAIFGEVGHLEATILSWTIHDLVTLFLLVDNVLALALAVLLPRLGRPALVRGVSVARRILKA